jgi:predicted dienelactone hydrolase
MSLATSSRLFAWPVAAFGVAALAIAAIPYPSLRPRARVAESNPGAAVRPPGLLATRMLWLLDGFVARAPRNDGWGVADPIDSVVIGRRLSVILATALIFAGGGARAAGFQFLDIPAGGGGAEIRGGVWSPCEAAPGVVTVGPFELPATRNCPIRGENLPLVVISHGRGGSFLGHHDLAETLADAGFVIVAINHPGDNALDLSNFNEPSIYVSRPNDIRRTLDFVLDRSPLKASVDPQAIGFFGFSRGGYTGLVLAGATPDWRASKDLCAASPAEPMCAAIGGAPSLPANREPRITAFALADPLNLFRTEGLKGATAPIQFWSSEFGGDGVTPQADVFVRDALPTPPEAHQAKGAGHFAFLVPCPASLAARAPAICADPPGFDRVAFHRDMNAAVLAFFRTTLTRPR